MRDCDARLAAFMSDPLFLASIALYVAGAGVIVGWLSRWRVLACEDELSAAPPHRLGFEHLLLAVGGYLLAAGLCFQIAQVFFPEIAAEATEPSHSESAAGQPALTGPVVVETVIRLTAGNVGQIFGLVICLVLAAHAWPGGVRAFVWGAGAVRTTTVSIGVTTALAAMPLCDGLAWLAEQALALMGRPDLARDHTVVSAILAPECPWWGVGVLWIGAAAIAPMAEEAFFRGIVQNCIHRVAGRAAALVLASLAFGISHASGQPQAVPALAVLGLLLSWAYLRSGSLLSPMLAHALFNLKTLVWVTLTHSP